MENFIELMDGTRIEAYPKAEQPDAIRQDNLALDTTGEYLQIGGRKRRRKCDKECDAATQRQRELFCRNVHRLIAASEEILSDSRMFLAPLPIRNNLAYFGTSAMSSPTLGVYIEWWRRRKCAWVLDEQDEPQPLVYIAGSPLSGANSCAYVDNEGEVCGVSVCNFSPVWRSFMAVNSRYTEAKQRFEAYTIEQVVEKLFG